MVTLSLVLGGTAFAAATVTHKDAMADTKLVKKLAPTLSVKHATTATSASSPATLASGKTETGEYGFGATGSANIFGNISFPFPLASAPTLHVIPSGTSTPSGCTGSVSNPGAAPGNLCIFEGYTEGGVVLTNAWEPVGGTHTGSTLGVTLWASGGGGGNNNDSGTWAVTAP
jgi:hypothetical protein